MEIIYTKSYDNSIKKLKKHFKEQEELNNIISYIITKDNFDDIIVDPLAKIYGFERLKHNLNEFYSFRLSKVIRLIVKPENSRVKVYLVYISDDHYNDFEIEKVIFYDE